MLPPLTELSSEPHGWGLVVTVAPSHPDAVTTSFVMAVFIDASKTMPISDWVAKFGFVYIVEPATGATPKTAGESTIGPYWVGESWNSGSLNPPAPIA